MLSSQPPPILLQPRPGFDAATVAAADLFPGVDALIPSGEPDMALLIQISSVSEYDLGGEGDLFKAPEPIIEDPIVTFDPVAAAISLLPGNEGMIVPEAMAATEMESIHSDLLTEVLYECEKDFLANSIAAESSKEVTELKGPAIQAAEATLTEGNTLVAEDPIQKSVSFCSLNSMNWPHCCSVGPELLNFQGLDLGAALELKRAYSEGDIQTLENGNFFISNASVVHPLSVGDHKVEDKTEERRQKLSRYKKKKSQRNFGRKIKYACRKALADSQPRIRGRFAKMEGCDAMKPCFP